jgi:hypothetical protein
MSKLIIATALLAAAVLPQDASDTKLGTGVSLKETTPIKALVERPREYVGKSVRVDGVATAVCSHMGCWLALASQDNPTGPTVRLKVDDGVIVFPMTAKGKKVSAEGVFETVGGTADSKEAAGEHAKADPNASQQYQLKATGAIIRER